MLPGHLTHMKYDPTEFFSVQPPTVLWSPPVIVASVSVDPVMVMSRTVTYEDPPSVMSVPASGVLSVGKGTAAPSPTAASRVAWDAGGG
eukprot:m.65551 g.65551  ORF g.65551 m.65551 type:complete len:89 (-) comp17993_c1_seq1:1285-1551(-)